MDSPLKRNLFWAVARLDPDPAWGRMEERDFQAIRSPALAPVMNLAWGPPTRRNLARARAFFGPLRHRWFMDPGPEEGLLAGAGYQPGEDTREMVLDLASATAPSLGPGVEVAEAGPGDWEAWCRICGEVFGTGAEAEAAVQGPFVQVAGHGAFLARLDGHPVATALVSSGEGTGGVHNVATLPPFRGRGLGAAVTWACVERARAWGLERLALYASPMGAPVYQRLGFRTFGFLREFLSPPSPPP